MSLNIAETKYGRLFSAEEEGVRVFRGVPFAMPPIGDRRFRPPASLEPWSGDRDATRHGAASWQVNTTNQARVLDFLKQIGGDKAPGAKNSPPFSSITYFQPLVSEDCLYLDIWTPAQTSDAALPVYVYYHGGANAGSAGSMSLERGARLAREEGVIVVRPSYRLGALGWVHFGLVCDALSDAVNLGLQDQMAALQWVHENIESFGGDPDNITIGGESAGATAVSHLITNPASRGLFKRAIIQSLSPFNQWCTQDRQEAASVAQLYLQILGIQDESQLRDIDPDRLLAVNLALVPFFEANKNCAWRPLGGVVDHNLIPEQPAKFLSGATLPADLDLLIGFAKDEWQFFRGHTETYRSGSADQALAVLAQAFGADEAKALFAKFSQIMANPMPAEVLSEVMSFEFFKYSSLKIAANVAEQGGRARVFQFAFDLPGQGGYLKAFHTGDMPFIWRNYDAADLKRWPAFEGVDISEVQASSDKFGRLYGAFIRDGEPGPDWPTYDLENQTILNFGREVEPKNHLLADELRAFEATGVESVVELERRLVANTRASLNCTPRALAAHRF